jgi:hypothetical protein
MCQKGKNLENGNENTTKWEVRPFKKYAVAELVM